MSEYSQGYRQKMYAVREDAGYGKASPPTAGMFQAREAVIGLTEERRARRDRKGHRSLSERQRGKRDVKWSVTLADAVGSDDGQSAQPIHPDIDPLYRSTFRLRISSAAEVLAFGDRNAAAPTSSGCDVALQEGDQEGFAPGYQIGLETVDGYRAVVIVEAQYDSADRRWRLSWSPELPAAPAAGTQISPAVNYLLQTQPQGSVTLHRGMDQHGECVTGAVPNSWSFLASAGDEALIETAGFGQDLARFGPMTLAENVNSTTTEFPVESLHAAILQNGVALYHVAPQSLEPETVAVTRTTAGSDEESPCLTVSRGLSSVGAKSHVAGTSLTPLYADLVTRGSPIAGIFGRVLLGDISFEVTRARVTLVENVKLRNDSYGCAVATGYLYPTEREVKVELDGFLKTGESPWAAAARMEKTSVALQIGVEPGRVHAFYLPSVELDIPEIEAPADAEIPLSLTGIALALDRDNPNSELFHAYL